MEELSPPNTYEEIFDRPDKDKWLEAINAEYENMKVKNVFKKVNEVPSNKNVVGTRWVFSYKRDDKGKIIKYKARLVARGFSQIFGVDYIEIFAPTLKQDSLRMIVGIANHFNFDILQLDIKAAYLNADLDEEIYMEIPKGCDSEDKGFWKLEKALYGLKQAGRMWNNKLNDTLENINFTRLKSEPCVYVKKDKYNKILCCLAVYVDDIIITGNKREIDIVKNEIKKNFEFSDIKPIDYIIGIKFIRCKDGYIMHQLNYLNKILDKFNIDKYKECSNLTFIEDEKLRNRKFDSQTYMQAVGSLLYLAMGTRPDIIFAVSKASRKNNNPTYEDWINVLKIFRYLKGTKNMGIKFNKSLFLSVYVDADLGGDNETKRSTTGFVVKLGSAPVTWYSKLQHCVAISTAESEYYSLNECALKCMWIKNFLNELGINIKCININIDNKAAIYNSKNETINPKSRHIDLRFHKIRELVKENKISLRYIKSQYNLADGFTKYLNGTLMKKFKNSLLTDFSKY